MLINLDQESKLHAWLLQGMTKTGRSHWKECADYCQHCKPTVTEVYAKLSKQDHIKYDQYTRAINHITSIPDMQGRLMVVVHQVRMFEQNLLRVMKNVNGSDWKRTFCEQTAYLSITTTDDQVQTYITSVMEVIHRLPKQLKWDSSKPKVQAITSGEEHSTGN